MSVAAPGREYAASLSRLEDVAPASWEALSRRPSFYLTYDWLAAMAGTLGSDPYCFLLAGPDGRPVAGFPVCSMTPDSYAPYDPLRVLAGVDRGPLAAVLAPGERERLDDLAARFEATRPAFYPVLTAVAPGFTSGLCLASWLSEAESIRVTDAALRELDHLARLRGSAAVGFLYVPEEPSSALDRVARARGYHAAVIAGRCRLELRWPTFDDYVRSRARTRRKSIRAEIARFQSRFGLRVAGVEALTDELAPLQAQWRRKYGRAVSEAELTRQYAAVRRHLGAAVRLFIATEGRRPVAFALFYEHEGISYNRAIGFDYASIEDSFCYFNVLFYGPIRDAIERGVDTIDYALESYAAKLGRGCRLQPCLLYLKPLLPAPPWLDEYLRLVDRAERAYFSTLTD